MKQLYNVKYVLSIVICISLYGCTKKGNDDPVISLHTRKARLCGTWQMVSGKSVSKEVGGNYETTYITDYDGINYTQLGIFTEQGNTYNGQSTDIYSLQLRFNKDGNAVITTTDHSGPLIQSGTWNFTGSIGSLKNKEQVIILCDHVQANDSTPFIFRGNVYSRAYTIKELRDKRLVLSRKDQVTYNTSSKNFNSTDELEEEMIFSKTNK